VTAPGKVYLIGAGPGDPGLISLRAVELLGRADAVLYDYLVNPLILRHCRPDAQQISLGKHGTGRVWTQAQIHSRLVELAQQGFTVVRLKSGDPLIFGRASEELEFLSRHGVPFEIVPGVTAALAAAAYAGVPLTQRDTASAVALITGQEDAEKAETSLDYAALARFPGTLAFYMGVTTVRHWSQQLLEAGMPANTPVAVLRRVSLPDQTRLQTTLGEVANLITHHRLRPPVVFLVGPAAAQSDWAWFERRPLFGRRILVTRPADQADELAKPLAELGADVVTQPILEIRPLPPEDAIPFSENELRQFDWLVFSSRNGVRCFFDALAGRGWDVRAVGHAKLAAIGPGTADALARYHLRADLVPATYQAEGLAESLAGLAAGRKFLLLRASRGREVLAEALTAAGGQVTQQVVYESRDVPAADPDIAAQLQAGQIHWVTVTSSAIARGLARLFGEDLRRTRLVSISPVTSATLVELGFAPAAEADRATMGGVIDAILAAEKAG
jgi:uroporphyrinogen III methyltransferase/synthase